MGKGLSGAGRRRKGATWEREVAKQMRAALGLPADVVKRGLGQTRSGSDVADVDGVPGFWPECKHQAEVYPVRALEQACAALAASGGSAIPVAVCKADRCEPTATLFLHDLIILATGGSACSLPHAASAVPVTLSFDHFLALLANTATMRAA